MFVRITEKNIHPLMVMISPNSLVRQKEGAQGEEEGG